ADRYQKPHAVIFRIANDECTLFRNANSMRLPNRRFRGWNSIGVVLAIIRADSRHGANGTIDGVDGANDVILSFREIDHARLRHRHAAWTVKGCLQRIASVAGVASLSGTGHSMNCPAL